MASEKQGRDNRGSVTGGPGQRAAGVIPSLSELERVRNLAELFGPKYEWDGACSCGAHHWEADEYWKHGYRVQCRRCGWWCCYHEIGSVAHTSEGKWAPYPHNRRPRPPAGCPTLTEGGQKPPEGV